VLVASPLALGAGVRVGMKRNGVLTLCPNAALQERDESRERMAIDGVAHFLLQYTPEVAFAEQHSLVMDIGASLAAFGGVQRLFRRAAADVLALGFTGHWGRAPTAQGAWLLTQALVSCCGWKR
jgi:protein ImuB